MGIIVNEQPQIVSAGLHYNIDYSFLANYADSSQHGVSVHIQVAPNIVAEGVTEPRIFSDSGLAQFESFDSSTTVSQGDLDDFVKGCADVILDLVKSLVQSKDASVVGFSSGASDGVTYYTVTRTYCPPVGATAV